MHADTCADTFADTVADTLAYVFPDTWSVRQGASVLESLRSRCVVAFPGQADDVHTPTSGKVLYALDLHKRKSYLRALLRIESLWQDGFEAMRPDQHDLFYQCLLAGDLGTPAGLRVADLRSRLKAIQGRGGVAEGAAGRGPADAQPEADDTAVVSSLRGSPLVQPAAPRQPGGAGGSAQLALADVEELGIGAFSADPAVLAASQGEEPPAPMDLDLLDEVVPGRLHRRGVDLPPHIPRMILGHRVQLVERMGTGGSVGLRVYCQRPEHAVGRVPCSKYRVVSSASTRLSPKEPAAFLQAWLQAADSFADRAAHMAFVPPLPTVRAALQTLE
jgi:hypothetical protein